MRKKRMAGEAIIDEQLMELLMADKYQAPVGHQFKAERIFFDGDELIAMDDNLGLRAMDTEPDVRAMYLEMLNRGENPALLGAIQHY